MADLRRILSRLGYGDVRTILNSGNAVFRSAGRSAHKHATCMRTAIADTLDVDVPVIVKSAREISAVLSGNRIAAEGRDLDASRLLVAFTADDQGLAALQPIATLVRAPEQVHTGTHALYLWCPNGILRSEAAAALLGRPGRAATTRNWSTVLRISEVLHSGPCAA